MSDTPTNSLKQLGSICVGGSCTMSIIADGEVTQEGLERLKAYIDLIQPWFRDNALAEKGKP